MFEGGEGTAEWIPLKGLIPLESDSTQVRGHQHNLSVVSGEETRGSGKVEFAVH
jgi:hypothetical protein